MGTTYRVDWLPNDGDGNPLPLTYANIEVRDYGHYLQAAQAFARRRSRRDKFTYYVIKTVEGRETGQWAYDNGFTCGFGFEGAARPGETDSKPPLKT